MPRPQGQKRPDALHRAAHIAGLIWMGVAVIADIIFLARYAEAGQYYASIRGPIMMLLVALLPGYLLFHWGSGYRYKKGISAAEALRPKAPFDRAAEAGHVVRIDADRNT